MAGKKIERVQTGVRIEKRILKVLKAIATHHEWFDGWGFPQGLKGQDIPLEGRLLAIAEFMVEMTTDNPLRAAWPADKLVDELKQRQGNQFDPELTELALNLIQAQKLVLSQERQLEY